MKSFAKVLILGLFLSAYLAPQEGAFAAPLLSNPTPIVEYNASTISAGGMTDAAGLTNATFANSPTVSGGVVTFLGSSSQYAVTSTDLSPTFHARGVSSEKTVSAFVYIYPTGDGVIFDELGTTTINNSWHDTQIELTGGVLKFRVWNCSQITSNVSISLNTWNYVGFTYDQPTQIMTAYVNGSQAGQLTGCARSTSWVENSVGLYYGFGSTSGTNMGSGAYGNFKLGQFDLYAAALTSSQVTSAYNSVRSNFNPLATPAAPVISGKSADTVTIIDTAVANASSYLYYLYASDGTTFIDSRTITTGAIGTGTTFTGLTPSTTYVVKMMAVGDLATYGNSPWSNGTTFTTNAGTTSLSLALNSGLTTATYRAVTRIKATVSVAGKVTFYFRGKKIPGCIKILSAAGFAYCDWRPSSHGLFAVTATFTPTSANYLPSSATSPILNLSARSNNR